jgi:predicted DNA-binding antitoxin AbrB/MazE fold protein
LTGIAADDVVIEGMKTIHAVYESGVFRPLETVELPERAEVEFEPGPVMPQEDRNARLDGIYAILRERYQSGEHDVAARHDEHQP